MIDYKELLWGVDSLHWKLKGFPDRGYGPIAQLQFLGLAIISWNLSNTEGISRSTLFYSILAQSHSDLSEIEWIWIVWHFGGVPLWIYQGISKIESEVEEK